MNPTVLQVTIQKKVKREKFTPDEDERLLKLVKTFKRRQPDWQIIAELMNKRSPRQYRERYRNYLCKEINNDKWTNDEDCLLMEKYVKFGNQWDLIAKYIPGKSSYLIRRRVNALLKQTEQINIESSNIESSEKMIDSIFAKILKLDRPFDLFDSNSSVCLDLYGILL